MGFQEKIYNNSPVFIQNLLVSAYGYTWRKRRFGGVFKQEYLKAKERENFAAEQWMDYQNEHLQQVLLHSFENVPFYQESFKKKGVDTNVIKKISVDTISQLPVLSKEDLRKYGSSTLLSGKREHGGVFFASSGSTGTPTQIMYSHAMHQRWFAIFEARVRNWARVSSLIPRGMIGGRRILAGAENKPPFYRYNSFEKQVYFSAYHISAQNAGNYRQGMEKHHAQYMTGYAMSNFFLARFFKELGIDAPQLKCVITSSEKLTNEMRTMFKEVYGCKTFDGWSGVEACGLITECEHSSLHISPDAGIIEVLDNNMNPAKAGEPGDVYCTGFLNVDQPLIRYKIGDQIILTDKTCSCGRAMPVVQEITGRIEDVVIGKDGREMVRFHGIFNGLHSVKQAQVIQESLDDIIIRLVTDGQLGDDERMLINKRIESQLGEMNIVIEEVENIPLTNNGKFQAVISKLGRKNHD